RRRQAAGGLVLWRLGDGLGEVLLWQPARRGALPARRLSPSRPGRGAGAHLADGKHGLLGDPASRRAPPHLLPLGCNATKQRRRKSVAATAVFPRLRSFYGEAAHF